MLRPSFAETRTSALLLSRRVSFNSANVSVVMKLVVTLPATAAAPAPAPETAAVRIRLLDSASTSSPVAPVSTEPAIRAVVLPPMLLTLDAAPTPADPPTANAPASE
ncbi:hypothetical protein D3C71_714730 [compost metagenome]